MISAHKSHLPALYSHQLRQPVLNMDVRARVTLCGGVVSEYAEAMTKKASFPPVVAFNDGKALWLADGHHRVEAARHAGHTKVCAEVRTGDRRDALLYACGANAAHGVRRTNADKRRAVKLILKDPEWRRWSNREVARRCVVDEGLVRQVRAKLSADDPQMAPAQRLVRRGTAIYSQRSARGAKVTPDQAAAIRGDFRDGQQIADEHGIHKSTVSRIRNHQIHREPDLIDPPDGLGRLCRAWSAAALPAREEFLRWLWSEHPDMISRVTTEPPATERRLAS